MNTTDQQIEDGYERLDGALAAPVDAAERVAGRVAVRRRRRRTAVAATTTLAVVAVAGAAVALASGSDGRDGVAVDQPSGPTSTLVLTRPDGSTYAFPEVTVSCTPPKLAGGDPLGEGPGRIWLYSPFHMTGTNEDDARITTPFFYVEAIVDKISGDRTFSWPNDWSMDTAHVPITVFVADTEGSPRGNEASSNEASEGTVHVLEASCDPVPVLRLAVDVTLGSEVEEGTLHVAGNAG